MVDELHRRRPSDATLEWVARSVAPSAVVTGWRRMTGGSPRSSVHRITVSVNQGAERRHVVLRRWMPGGDEWTVWTRSAVGAEAALLVALERTSIPAPRAIAISDGFDSGGDPAILMSRAPGRIHLTPAQPHEWVGQMAVMLARIHDASITAPPWEPRVDVQKLVVPLWARTPEVWQSAIDAAREAGEGARTFIHRDYQHFNMLWRGERLSSVVDWVDASTGPPDIDVGHCRLNLAVLFSPQLAEQFRDAYEAEAGRTVEGRWDITALLSFNDGWHSGIPRQVDGRTPVDHHGMNARVEQVLAAAVERL